MSIVLHRRRFVLAIAALCLVLAVPTPGRAADDDDEFNVPPTAPPGNRTGGAARTEGVNVRIWVLAPSDTVGLTTREQPVIYWYASGKTDKPVLVSINDPRDLANPVLDATLPAVEKAGIHKLDLATMKQDGKPVKLARGVKYEMVVQVEAKGNAGDPTTTCPIMYVDPAQAGDAAKESDPAKRAAAYGKAGIWFDYLDALNEAIAAKPNDEALLQKRARALAKQRLIWKPDGSITEERKSDAKQ